MTSHVARLYVAAGSLLGFFVAWAGVAAHPWTTSPAADPTAQAVEQYEQRLQIDAELVKQLEASRGGQAAAPPVRVVTLPPLTMTRSS